MSETHEREISDEEKAQQAQQAQQAKKQLQDAIAFFANRAISHRDEMPEHEEKHVWLCTLLDAYAIINGAVTHLFEEEEKRGNICACKVGCHLCCIEPIPAGPLESLGLAFAVRYYLQGEAKERLQRQILEHNGNVEWKNGSCPFLIDGTCSIYALRPIACRSYLAVNSPCYKKEGGVVAFHNEIKNLRVPDNIALQLANLHITQTCKEMGLFTEENTILNYDNAQNLFLDIRHINWLKDDRFVRFFGE